MQASRQDRPWGPPTLRAVLFACLVLAHTAAHTAQNLSVSVCEHCSNYPTGNGPPCLSTDGARACQQYGGGHPACARGTKDVTKCDPATASPCYDPLSDHCWPYVHGTGVCGDGFNECPGIAVPAHADGACPKTPLQKLKDQANNARSGGSQRTLQTRAQKVSRVRDHARAYLRLQSASRRL